MTERALMTEAICTQGWDVPRLAWRLEESSIADAKTTSPKGSPEETAASRAAEIFYELQKYDSNQLIDAVYDDRFRAKLHL